MGVFAQETAVVTPQPVGSEFCNKIFTTNSERLLYLTFASLNANKFDIEEIQSRRGYVVFTAANKKFLAHSIAIDGTHSILKITPLDNVYYFAPGVVSNVFKYIDLNKNIGISVLN